MEDKERLNQLEVILAELIHSNELSEKRIAQNEITIEQNAHRILAVEKLNTILSIVLILIGGGTLFSVLKLLGLY